MHSPVIFLHTELNFHNNFLIFVVKVKWGRENFPNVSVNTEESPLVFKTQLFTLTGVQVHRQKVMCKGVALKDEEWNFQLKDVRIFDHFQTKWWLDPFQIKFWNNLL